MFDIVKKSKIFFAIPVAILLVAVVMYVVCGGFVLGVDFAGGSEIVMDIKTTIDKDEISKVYEEATGKKPAAVQESLINKTEVTVKGETLTDEQSEKVWEAFKEKYSLEDADRLSVQNVSPTIGKELGKNAVIACILAVILMLVYISIRFEFLSGVAAIIALVHNVLILISAYVIFRMPLDTTFIAAILTVIGYSINDTIVIFDRIRENVKFNKKAPFAEVSAKSIIQSLTRTVNTSVTTLLTIVLLFILGVDSIKNFSLALIIGITCGTYSSICIATPVWVLLRGEKSEKTKK